MTPAKDGAKPDGGGDGGATPSPDRLDRLWNLLPEIYRYRDVELGYPLRALLRVVAEQVNVLEDDVARVYDNWFIETCEQWVVPYLGDLIGYRPANQPTPGAGGGGAPGRFLSPRQEVAGTIGFRRRKGTLALLEDLAQATAGWPARAVEFRERVGAFAAINHLRHDARGRLPDVRDARTLARVDGGPFDTSAGWADVRRPASGRTPGRRGADAVGLYVWRLEPFPVTCTPAGQADREGRRFSFSVLGNNCQLFARPDPEHALSDIAGELNLPIRVRTRMLEERMPDGTTRASADFYGPQRSFAVWVDEWAGLKKQWVPNTAVIPASLDTWGYRAAPPGRTALLLDPERGRIAFPANLKPPRGVAVYYHYGFSAAVGGGEYERPAPRHVGPGEPLVLTVRQEQSCALPGRARDAAAPQGLADFTTIAEAFKFWQVRDDPVTVIEIGDSGHYNEERLRVTLGAGRSLHVRAADGCRPVIRLDDDRNDTDGWIVTGDGGGRLSLEGLLIYGCRVRIEGPLSDVDVRHCTLVPGWSIGEHCERGREEMASLELRHTTARVSVRHSILGSIEVVQHEVRSDPMRLSIADSIVDATGVGREAIGRGEAQPAPRGRAGPGDAPPPPPPRNLGEWGDADTAESLGKTFGPPPPPHDVARAHATLRVERTTVIGVVRVHAIELAENCIFNGEVFVDRRHVGCVRYSYVPTGSRTPPRYRCQPDTAEADAAAAKGVGRITDVAGGGKPGSPPPGGGGGGGAAPSARDLAAVAASNRAAARGADATARVLRAARRLGDPAGAAPGQPDASPPPSSLRPAFYSLLYGYHRYCQLAPHCPEEIRGGADDGSEMGAFHDLFQPQRMANLRARIDEHTPAGVSAAIILET